MSWVIESLSEALKKHPDTPCKNGLTYDHTKLAYIFYPPPIPQFLTFKAKGLKASVEGWTSTYSRRV